MAHENEHDGGANGEGMDDSVLDRALDATFGRRGVDAPGKADMSASVLQKMRALAGDVPVVSLRDAEPPGGSRDAAACDRDGDVRVAGRYLIADLLGQGGVGVVHRGRDRDLGRAVAIKLLRAEVKDRPAVLHRFVEEAQIGGQLQHPGIVPVYELGMADGSPFIAMKLVKGDTLAQRLAARASPASDRHAFLTIFEKLCQAMAYAHACGVVHRDLKPANVMIGSFGEVQILDWGMGKVLASQGAPVEEHDAGFEPTSDPIAIARSSEAGDRSALGTVMGTPAYMPPEQARGDVDRMNERSDVFALGAILCEVLTGQPPYVGRDERDVLWNATRAKLDDAHERLAACGADRALADLARSCLTPEPDDRPRSAGVVARAMREHLTSVEARAQEARVAAAEAEVRAASLARIQRLSIALTIAIGLGLAATLWLWQAAETQRARAEDNFADFNRLSYVVRLRRAKATADTLHPAWPDKAQEIRDWLDNDARDLRNALPRLRETFATLLARAMPETEAEKEESRSNHPRAAELVRLRKELAWLRRAHALRTGAQDYEPHRFNEAKLPKTAPELNELAWPLVHPRRRIFGNEAAGLELARRAVALPARTDSDRARRLNTLASALFANGFDHEALERGHEALATAPEGERSRYHWYLQQLEKMVAAASGPEGRAAIERAAEEVAELEEIIEREREYRFANDGDRFLHETLRALIADIDDFVRNVVPSVERRGIWAERVEDLTIDRYRDRWEESRRAILRADGVTASEQYAEVPIDLSPQQGLVPIGMNPRSKLWEFYHVRSGWDPEREDEPGEPDIPAYDADGNLDVSDRGIVFVLIPGGKFFMGSQSGDQRAPNWDRWAQPDEAPVRELELAPYFLSKYELTQGQWARLSGGDRPSWHRQDQSYPGMPVPVGDSHPVEQVSQESCVALLARHGLVVPTEAQWERGARGGTTTPWSTGAEPASLEGFANLLDETGRTAGREWKGGEPFDDGFKVPAPVGTYAPNRFGLHDVHGNVAEWVRDWYAVEGYRVWPRPGDGLRSVQVAADSAKLHAQRGGSVTAPAHQVRSADRYSRAPDFRSAFVGVRPARPVQP